MTEVDPEAAAAVASRIGADTDAPVQLAAALQARGITALLNMSHHGADNHTVTITVDQAGAREIAERIDASDLGISLRRARTGMEALGSSSHRAGAVLRLLVSEGDICEPTAAELTHLAEQLEAQPGADAGEQQA